MTLFAFEKKRCCLFLCNKGILLYDLPYTAHTYTYAYTGWAFTTPVDMEDRITRECTAKTLSRFYVQCFSLRIAFRVSMLKVTIFNPSFNSEHLL